MDSKIIAAEAANRIYNEMSLGLGLNTERATSIIEAAIEKAVEPWRQRYELALSDSQRRGDLLDKDAAHASEWYWNADKQDWEKRAAHTSESPESAYHRGYDAGWEAHKERKAHGTSAVVDASENLPPDQRDKPTASSGMGTESGAHSPAAEAAFGMVDSRILKPRDVSAAKRFIEAAIEKATEFERKRADKWEKVAQRESRAAHLSCEALAKQDASEK